MKRFFNRYEEEIEDNLEEEEDDLDIINLDETEGWSKLEVAEKLAEQQAANLMEEIGDELAIIDVVEEDIKIEELKPHKANEASTYTATKSEILVRELEELSEEDLDAEEFSEEGVEIEQLQDGDIEIEQLQDDDIEIEQLQDNDIEIEQLQDDDIEIEQLNDDDVEYITTDDEEEEDEEEEESPFVFFENLAVWFSRWTVMDKVVAVTGVLVLAVAILTVGIYAGNRSVDKQVEAFAPVGEQLETIGVVGQDKLLAVADAKKAMLEAAKLEAELNQEYEENELSSEINVIMKMTSVQKDLKIKFVNKKTGKLVGNVPFEVKITDADNKTYNKIDEDMDGIIYLTKINPGNYSVSMVELDDLEGYSFSTSAEKIKVKENIEYEKVDVSDEIKDQSEVDVSKEDTAQKTETEGSLTDTVEWVESSRRETGSQETYTQVNKDTIADPSLSASLNLDLGILKVIRQGMLSTGSVMTLNEDTTSGNTTVAVTGIALNKTELTLTVGEDKELSATVIPEDASDKTVTWSSDKPEIASVDANGKVTGKGAGTAVITAKAADKTAACVVTVSEPAVEVTGVALNKTSLELKAGKTAALTATVIPENASVKTVTWSSDKSEVASVDENGMVTAKTAGTAIVTAAIGNKSASCTVTVTEDTVENIETKIVLDKTTASMKPGETITLKATVTPEGKSITWKSSDENKATVSEGKVTAKAEGEVTITATVDEKSASCKITISKAYDAKNDTTTSLKDKSGNQIYVLVNGNYVEAKAADYYKHNTFYKKEIVSQYIYTGWQNLDGKTYYFDKNGNKVTGEQVIQGARYSFNSDGTLNTGSGILGIDVSTWNGNIDWNKVKNSGVSYVIIRTGFRGSTQGALVEDNKFRQNIQGATNAGIKVGVYFFSQAVNEVEAVEEASMVLSQIKGYKITYPVFIDVEPSGGRADSLSSGDRTKVINAFCQTIQNGGYRAGIYANKTWLSQKMNVSALSGYKIWLAQYNSTVTYSGRYDMWQYSDKGTVSGISGKVDMNLSYLTY